MTRTVLGTVQDAGVDYLTVTFNDRRTEPVLGIRLGLVTAAELKAGSDEKPWTAMGYVGRCVGGLQWGQRHDGWIVRLSGPCAYEHWKPFARMSTNCSRIDLQVTMRFESEVSGILSSAYRRMAAHKRKSKRNPAVSLWSHCDGPSTVYSGKRCSDLFARIYDKGAESKLDHYQNCVRYEIEVKGPLAQQVMSRCLRSESASAEALLYCWSLFRNRGLNPPWASDDAAMFHRPRSRPDVARRLEWLTTGVRGTVASLVESGYYNEVLEALGLTEGAQAQTGPCGPSRLSA